MCLELVYININLDTIRGDVHYIESHRKFAPIKKIKGTLIKRHEILVRGLQSLAQDDDPINMMIGSSSCAKD